MPCPENLLGYVLQSKEKWEGGGELLCFSGVGQERLWKEVVKDAYSFFSTGEQILSEFLLYGRLSSCAGNMTLKI